MEWQVQETIEQRIVITIVKFDFMEEPVEVVHFNPSSEDDINMGIQNRYVTEFQKVNGV